MKFLMIQLLVMCCSILGFAQTTNSSLDSLTNPANDPNMQQIVARNATTGQHTELGDYCPECRKNMLKLRQGKSNLFKFTNPGDEASNMMKKLNKGRK
jgi:hypothetical protein